MNKKTLTFLMITSLTVLHAACFWMAYGAETDSSIYVYGEEASVTSYEDFHETVLGNSDDASMYESMIDDESFSMDSFEEEFQIETESDSDTTEDQVIVDDQEDILEDMDGIIDDSVEEEGILYASSDSINLEVEFKTYNLIDGIPYYLLKPAQSGIYYFVGNISDFSALDQDDSSVKWIGPINPMSKDGTVDRSIYVVAAELTADIEYEFTIIGESFGSFYYYRAPGFCVKFIASTTAEDELLQNITYTNQAGGNDSFQAQVYPLVQSTVDSRYYFLTYNPYKLPGEPVDNGDGTYFVDVYDFFTDKLVGHNRDGGRVIRAATCAEAGMIQYSCNCGETFEELIPKTNDHIWSAYNENGDRTCLVCGTKQHDASQVKKTEPVYDIAGKPAKVKIKAAGNRMLTVSWKLPVKSKLKRIKGYYIEVATDRDFTNIIRTKKVKKSKNTFTFNKLQKGQKYFVRVRFYKGTQISEWSAVRNKKVK